MLKNFDLGVKRGWALRVVSTVMAVALLASCGGEAAEKFVPNRVMAFGDEHSAIEDGSTNASPNSGTGQGQKYTINSAPAGSPLVSDCYKNQIWVQIVATSFGLAFKQCPAGLNPAALGRSWAEEGATVSMIKLQVDAFMLADSFNEKDLVLLMGGMHDVLNLYLQYDHANAASSEAALIAQATVAGQALGAQVTRMTDAKAKVVVALQPDLSLSPYALREDINHPGENRKLVLSKLSVAFNSALRNKLQEVRGGGRFAGLALTAGTFTNISASPTAYGYTDATTVLCGNATVPAASPTPPPPAVLTCNDDPANVQPDNIAQYLWADYLRYSPAGHLQFGVAASTRAADNSF